MADTTTRGWQSGKSQNDCHQYMLENHVDCDVTIKFPESESKELMAHKYMLVCRSPVFEAMLTGGFQEGQRIVIIPDVEPDVFLELLKYMYYDGAVLTGHNVLHILYAAKKYLIDGLVDQCKHFLDNEISSENVCSILTNCMNLDEQELTEKCMELLVSETEAILDSEDFLNLSHTALLQLLKADEHGVCDEARLFRACVKWAEHVQSNEPAKNIRDTLGSCLYEIRFTNISADTLVDLVEEYPDVLTFEEQCLLLCYLTKQDDKRRSAIISSGFNSTSRTSSVPVEIHATPIRFQSVEGNPGIWSTSNNTKIGFISDKNVKFYGVTTFGGFIKGNTKQFTLKLLQGDACLVTKSAAISYTETKDPIRIEVDKPVPITHGVLYVIELNTDVGGFDTYFGKNGQTTVQSNGVMFTFNNVSESTTTTVRGQIPQILFTR